MSIVSFALIRAEETIAVSTITFPFRTPRVTKLEVARVALAAVGIILKTYGNVLTIAAEGAWIL